jgi:circadian clock protein KaiC
LVQPSLSGRVALERVGTGVEALDNILGGGIPVSSVVFIAGLPGTGKTILAEQTGWANARRGAKALFVGTLSEPTIKMLRFSQTVGYFDAALVDRSVVYADVSTALRSGEPDAILAEIDRLVSEHRPTIVVIDSFKAIQDKLDDPLAFRVFTTTLSVRMSVWEATALLVGEYTDVEIRERPEFAIADGIIYLYGTEDALRQERRLRIMKMRGTSFFAGDHSFDITGDGITVFPRLRPTVSGEYAAPTRRIGSVIDGASEIMDGGLFDSTTCLISGSTGSGKTLLALSFAVSEARAGGRVLFVSMEESSDQITRNCIAFGWELETLKASGNFAIMHISPSELNIDRHAVILMDRAIEMGATMVVLDSISSFEAAVPDTAKYESHLWAVTDHFKREGVTTIMTSESALEGHNGATPHISLFADAIITVASAQTGDHRTRTLRVVKMRGSKHDPDPRELFLDAPRIGVGPVPIRHGHSD